MNNFLVEYKKKKDRKSSKKYIIENAVQQIQNINLLNISVSELYHSIDIIQQNLKNIQ